MKKRECKICRTTIRFGFDYSNLNFTEQRTRYDFPDRIIFPSIPKDSSAGRIICAKCASKLYPLKCKKHGLIQENYSGGLAPLCQKCKQENYKNKTERFKRIFSEKIQTIKTNIEQKKNQIQPISQADIDRFKNKVTNIINIPIKEYTFEDIVDSKKNDFYQEPTPRKEDAEEKTSTNQQVNKQEKAVNNKKLIVEELKSLSTNELYKRYNAVKKENLLIGLFSDLMFFDKELESDIPLGELEKQLKQCDLNEFRNNKRIYTATLEKLLLFSETLPELKKNFVLMDSFYPHNLFESESKHLDTIFGEEFTQKLKETEEDYIFYAFKQNINLLIGKFNKIFPEIEKSLSIVDSIFSKQGIQKSLMSKIAKAAPSAGQTILVGSMVAVGGAAGVTILAGMLGIRAMGDILNHFKSEEQDDYQLKNSAEKIFNWWGLFRTTLPGTIYELNLQINKENKRTAKRDQDIFFHLKRNNQISNDVFNDRLRRQITKSIELREHEVLLGTGMCFNEVSSDILIKLKGSTNTRATLNRGTLS